MIIAGCASKNIQNIAPENFNGIEIWSIKDPSWKCVVNLGSAGLSRASWSPDSRHVITVDQFYVNILLTFFQKVFLVFCNNFLNSFLKFFHTICNFIKYGVPSILLTSLPIASCFLAQS